MRKQKLEMKRAIVVEEAKSDSQAQIQILPNQKRRKHKSLLQVYDLFLHNDLQLLSMGNFYMFARPDGERCLLTASRGQTVVKNAQGHQVMPAF